MEIWLTKGREQDAILVRRDNGTEVRTSFPHKGPVPHDAVHLFVERGLGLRHGFWGMVATGRHPEELGALAAGAGHRSAARCETPDPAIVELIQAERLVECFEADLWSGGGSDEQLLSMAATACEASFVSLPSTPAGSICAIREELRLFAQDWTAAPVGHEASLNWN